MTDSVLTPPDFYKAGGSLSPETPSYIERAADVELYNGILAGEFCYVLTSRQMGKSSLMARTARRLLAEGKNSRAAILDLSKIGGESADQWYYGLAHSLVRQFGVQIDMKAWWEDRIQLPALQRLSEFFETLLGKISDRLVIFIDEIDWTIALPFSDDFFAAIRACYNARATQPIYDRLTFVLLGVASPSDLIKDPTRTPFNIGRRIDLTDFTAIEAKLLARGLNGDESQSDRALDRILFWSGGHPYLTQKLCDLMVKHADGAASAEAVDRLVEEHFFTPETSRAEYNLAFVHDRLTKNKRSTDLLTLYRRIYTGKAVLDDPISPVHSALKLSGLVIPREDRVLRVRNRIYERVFTDRWAKEAMPANWNQRVAVGSMAVLLLGIGVWYEILQPRPYIETLQTASEDYQVAYQAYQNLHSVVGYRGMADRLLAEFWDRRSIRAQVEGDRDRALLTSLQAFNVNESEIRRRQATLLVGPDYDNLASTYRHGDFVRAVAFSPDGKLVLTGSADRTVRVWRADSGMPMWAPMHHEGMVTAVAFSPDGKLALTGSTDGTARLWSVGTGAPIAALRHRDSVTAIAFSPNGKLALTGSRDRTARLWRTDIGSSIAVLRHDGTVWSVAFSRDGRLAVTGSGDGSARLWRTDTGGLIAPLHHEKFVTAVAFSPDGKIVLTGSGDRSARLWRTDTGASIRSPLHHEGAVTAVAFSPDGKSILTASDEGSARLWRTDTGGLIASLHHENVVTAVSFSPDGNLVLTGSEDRSARLWRTDTGAPVGTPLRHKGSVTAVTFSPDGKLVLTGSDDGTARLWRTENRGAIGQPFGHDRLTSGSNGQILLAGLGVSPARVTAVVFSPDGKLVLTGSDDGTARLWRTESGGLVGPPFDHGRLTSGLNGQILLAGIQVSTARVTAVAFSPDGKLLLTGGSDGTAYLWRTDTGNPVGTLLRHKGSVTAVTFSPDGKLVLTGSDDGTARLWRTETGAPVGPPLDHGRLISGLNGQILLAGIQVSPVRVKAVAFSPDGKLLLTGGSNSRVRLWRTDTGNLVGTLLRHEGSVTAVKFSPDGKFLLTGGSDGSVRLWQTDGGVLLGVPVHHDDYVFSVAISMDGKTFLAFTQWWVHTSRLESDALISTSSRLLSNPGPWHGAYHFLNDSGNHLKVAVKPTGDTVGLESLRLDASDVQPIVGHSKVLLQEWQNKLALKFEDGKFVPLWPVAVDSGSRGGGFESR